jgi:DNA-binding MarR family transcriptional regulator
VDHALQSRSRRMESELGVTGPQRLVIRVVGRFPGLTAGQLAEVLAVHPSTVTGLLDRLEAKGLIERRRDSRDRRRSFLGLTPAGSAISQAREGTVEDAVQRVLRSLPKRKRAAAAEVLRALAAALERDPVNPPRPAPPARPPKRARRRRAPGRGAGSRRG